VDASPEDGKDFVGSDSNFAKLKAANVWFHDDVKKVRNYCIILGDDSFPYGDYAEELIFLLFLRMAGEQMPLPLVRNESPNCRDYQPQRTGRDAAVFLQGR
jgi:hypothetical protein